MTDPDELARMRVEYGREGLSAAAMHADPIVQFGEWLDVAVAAGIHEPNAMVLSTVRADGGPAGRIVLLKGLGPDGFRFFTNVESRKGDEVAADPRVALTFLWHAMGRSVRVEGEVSALPRPAVEEYFASRHRSGQLGAWASHQSQPIADRAALDRAWAEADARFGDADIGPPPYWGGYVVRPEMIEFWQGGWARLHDRLVYRRTAGPDPADPADPADRADPAASWEITRLAP